MSLKDVFCGIQFWAELFSQWSSRFTLTPHGKSMMHRCSLIESMSYLGGAMHQCPNCRHYLSGWEKQQPLHRCEWTLQRNLTRRLRWRLMTAKGSLDLWNDSATTPTKKGYKDDENHSECFEYFLWDWLRMDWLRSVEGVHFGDGKFYVWVLGVKFTSDMKLSHWSWHWMFHICQDKVIISTDEQITWK